MKFGIKINPDIKLGFDYKKRRRNDGKKETWLALEGDKANYVSKKICEYANLLQWKQMRGVGQHKFGLKLLKMDNGGGG